MIYSDFKKIELTPIEIESLNISSASSLINMAGRIFVCNDDQYGLFELSDDHQWIHHEWSDAPGLPKDHLERKKLKPDFEAILDIGHDKILLIPSGSKPNRTKALEFDLTRNQFTPFDMTDFFNSLFRRNSEINIEGAVNLGENHLFLNRGVSSRPSTLINVNSSTFGINSISEINFGAIDGIELHGSELSLFGGQLYCVAVAEATENSYDDGTIIGSSLVQISLENLRVVNQWVFDRAVKIEGLCRRNDKWLVATDPDGVGASEFYTFNLLESARTSGNHVKG